MLSAGVVDGEARLLEVDRYLVASSVNVTSHEPRLRGVYVGGTGDVAILADGDTVAVTFVGVLAGTLLPVKAKKVMSTNTSATALVGLL